MRGAAAMREFEPDWIVAMGGGSPIDAAKAMWAFYEYPEVTFEDLITPFSFPTLRTKAKFCAIPSTSGTATEVTAFAVITDYAKGIKYPLADFNITPDIAIVDPDLAEKMPPKLTAHTGMDAMTHAIEAYVSTLHCNYTDPLALHAIKLIHENLKKSYDGDMAARDTMHDAQCLAGMAFSNALLGIVHSMAHKTGAAYSGGHIIHGAANAMYLPKVIKFNARNAEAAGRYAEIARFIDLPGSTTEELVDALTDYYMYREMTAALEGSQPMLEQNLASAQTQLQRGTGTQEAVDSAQAQLDELDRQLAQYQTGQEQARLTIQELCKLDPEDYDLQKVLITFDPVELDASALVTAAVEYAQAAAAGQYEVDTAALERQVKSAVLDLSMAYESIRSARESVTQAASEVETQTQAYATGSGTKEALYSAQCAQNEAAAGLCQAIGTFTKQANQLNTLSGGWIAETYDWMPDTFGTLFQSEILRGQEAAQAAQEEREQQEQEAAQAIQEEQAQQEEQQTAQTEPAA